MSIDELLKLAKTHIPKAQMQSSAKLCLDDATAAYISGDIEKTRLRALKSLAYSIGIFHSDYIEAAK